jgi:hypothetical protein
MQIDWSPWKSIVEHSVASQSLLRSKQHEARIMRWCGFVQVAALRLATATSYAEEIIDDGCNDPSLSLLEFGVLNATDTTYSFVGGGYSHNVVWQVQLANGTIVDQCQNSWGCDLTDGVLNHRTCIDLSLGCHRLVLVGEEYDAFSAVAWLDGKEFAYVPFFQKFAIDIGDDCERCSDKESTVEIFVRSHEYSEELDDNEEYKLMYPSLNWQSGDDLPGTFDFQESNHYYEKVCVEDCTTVTFYYFAGGNLWNETGDVFVMQNAIEIELRVDGSCVASNYYDNFPALDWAANLFGQSYYVGRCTAADLCESSEQLLEVELTAFIHAPDMWFDVRAIVKESKRTSFQWLTWNSQNMQMIANNKKYHTCVPVDTCATLFYQDPVPYLEVQSTLNGTNISPYGSCGNTKDAMAREYCRQEHLPDDWYVVPLGGMNCPRYNKTQKAAIIGLPLFLIVAIIVLAIGIRKKTQREKIKQAEQQWAHAVAEDPNDATNRDTGSEEGIHANLNEDVTSEEVSSDDEC